MIYNLEPIKILITENTPSGDIWIERLNHFFAQDDYDPYLTDWYYDKLINNISEVKSLLNNGYFIDPYSGLFSFPSLNIEANHSFNLAYFINKNPQQFFGKKILTLCSDFGIVNIQAKMCGLNVVSAIQKEYLNVGSILCCIGNGAPPYPINKFDFEQEDVMILSCVFQDDDLSYKNWEMMVDMKAQGKEVFFTSNSYFFLRKYMNYDKIELVIDPKKVYNEDDYADMAYGYMNKIYRLK